jgi:hypothetical protein
VRDLTVPLERMPVFVRAGSVIPTQLYSPPESRGLPNPLIVTAYPGAKGSFSLYEDEGDGLGYRSGRSARTRFVHRERGRGPTLTIGAARGSFPGRLRERRYEVRFAGVATPRLVTVDGRRVRRVRRVELEAARGWWYESATRTVVVRTGNLSNRRSALVALGIR